MKPACCLRLRVISLTEGSGPYWIYEAGIGEDRAALVLKGHIIEAHIDRRPLVACGLVCKAKITKWLGAGRGAIVRLDVDGDALVHKLPKGLTDGHSFRVEIKRESISEATRIKLPLAVATDAACRNAPTLLERITDSGYPVMVGHPHDADHLAEAGWFEAVEEAATGYIPFTGGSLLMALTPAMTIFDIDGDLPAAELALAGAKAAAQTIRRFGIGGNIGIDFPNGGARAQRLHITHIFDGVMKNMEENMGIGEARFERTAVNGYGFMQVITPRPRSSFPEIIQNNPARTHALALLRLASRDRATGPLQLTAHQGVITILESRQDWLSKLSKDIGRNVLLRADAALPIWEYYVSTL